MYRYHANRILKSFGYKTAGLGPSLQPYPELFSGAPMSSTPAAPASGGPPPFATPPANTGSVPPPFATPPANTGSAAPPFATPPANDASYAPTVWEQLKHMPRAQQALLLAGLMGGGYGLYRALKPKNRDRNEDRMAALASTY